jgi:hypothetical protein
MRSFVRKILRDFFSGEDQSKAKKFKMVHLYVVTENLILFVNITREKLSQNGHLKLIEGALFQCRLTNCRMFC